MSVMSSTRSINSPIASYESDVIAFEEVPLTVLSKQTLQKLSRLLNSKKIIPSKEGYERDWRGLACLAKINHLYDEKAISLEDPITKIIQLWCRNNPKTATISYLENFLRIIDRWDVSDDISENLVVDTKIYQTKKHDSLEPTSEGNVIKNHCHGSDANILTEDDVMRAQNNMSPQIYDAFVLYADADYNYAYEMLTKLENNPEYGFKLCMKDRDLLAGIQFEHVALTQLIEERCKHLIVILTEEFFKSPENNFFVNYTLTLQIQHKTRKIIPILYEDNINMPRILKIYTPLRYKQSTSSLTNFWSKLANSIRNVNVISDTSLNRNTTNGSSVPNNYTSNKKECPLNESISTSNEIPSISTTPPEDNKELTTATTTTFSSKIKRKNKWSTKVLKKVFKRRNCKVVES